MCGICTCFMCALCVISNSEAILYNKKKYIISDLIYTHMYNIYWFCCIMKSYIYSKLYFIDTDTHVHTHTHSHKRNRKKKELLN